MCFKIAPQQGTVNPSRAGTYAEAVKSPPPKKMNRGGLKMKEKPKEKGQKTLKEAMEAGKVYEEGKRIRRQALQAQNRVIVSLNWIYWE